ncbi:MAG: PIN domain-containing protein [Sedimentibacter sp.]
MLTPPGIDKSLINYGLISLEITDEEFFYAINIRNRYPKLSGYDAIALAIAKVRSFILLTGDIRLRKAAADEDIGIRGTIWVFDELLRENIITEYEFDEFMKEIKRHNGKDIRLPEIEINKRIK